MVVKPPFKAMVVGSCNKRAVKATFTAAKTIKVRLNSEIMYERA